MSQITLYLDSETERLVNECAKASGLSKSRWVSQVLQQHLRDTWPAHCLGLAGAFPDFPLRADRDVQPEGEDVPRIGF